MTKYFSLQGTSGAGKGTRTLQLIKFLIHKGFDYKNAILDLNGNKINMGLYFKDLNTLFVGKVNRGIGAAKLYSWSSGDVFTGNCTSFFKYTDTENIMGSDMLDLLTKTIDASLICEGYPGTCPYPLSVGNIIGYNNIYCVYYAYPDTDDKVEYIRDRCYTRTGKKPKGWASASSECRSRNAFEQLADIDEAHKYLQTFDAPVTHFGQVYLEATKPELVNEFLEWSENNCFIRHVEMEDRETYNNGMINLKSFIDNHEDKDSVSINHLVGKLSEPVNISFQSGEDNYIKTMDSLL